jgi:Zn-dependent M28 family amino/carboxypeptidase
MLEKKEYKHEIQFEKKRPVRTKVVKVTLFDSEFKLLEDKNLFKGEEMTYFGRWTYKYEEAARKGADAVLIIHEEKDARIKPKNSYCY